MISGHQVLHRRAAEMFTGWRILIVLALSAGIAAFILGSVVDFNVLQDYYPGLEGEVPGAFLALISVTVFVFVIGPVLLLRATMRDRIEIGPTGIAYFSEVPYLFQALRPDWLLTWSQIDSAELSSGLFTNPLISPLTVRAGDKTYRLMPWQWIDRNQTRSWLRGMFDPAGKDREGLRLLVADTPVMRAFREQGKLDVEHQADSAAEPGLDHSRTAQIIAAVFVAAVAYFIVDLYIGLTETYAGGTPWHLHAAIALGGFLVAAAALHRAQVLSGQGQLMAVIFAFGIGLASYPFLLRLNAWTDPSGHSSYTYTLTGSGAWVAGNGMPDLTFESGREYWDQFEPGEQKEFRLRKGGLGFYQVDMQTIYDEQSAFYVLEAL